MQSKGLDPHQQSKQSIRQSLSHHNQSQNSSNPKDLKQSRQTMNWNNISWIESQREPADSFLDKIREEKRILQLKELEL